MEKRQRRRAGGPQLKPARFLDPKTDVVFKKIFGNNPHLVKSFLNAILPLKADQLIESLEYLPVEQVPRLPALKNTVVDVKCRDKKGRIFIVEMQLNWTTNFLKRLLFGTSKAFVEQIRTGEDYQSLCPVYGLGIINGVFDETEEWFHHYQTINVKNSSKVLEGLELVFLELPKFKPQTFEHRKMGVLWLRFLREINDKLVDIPEEFMESPELCRAIELVQESAYTEGELAAYDHYWDAVRVEKTIQRDALEKGLKEGEAIGIQKGEAIGIQKGEAIGIEKGVEMEKQRLKDRLKKLIAKGVDPKKIFELFQED